MLLRVGSGDAWVFIQDRINPTQSNTEWKKGIPPLVGHLWYDQTTFPLFQHNRRTH